MRGLFRWRVETSYSYGKPGDGVYRSLIGTQDPEAVDAPITWPGTRCHFPRPPGIKLAPVVSMVVFLNLKHLSDPPSTCGSSVSARLGWRNEVTPGWNPCPCHALLSRLRQCGVGTTPWFVTPLRGLWGSRSRAAGAIRARDPSPQPVPDLLPVSPSWWPGLIGDRCGCRARRQRAEAAC